MNIEDIIGDELAAKRRTDPMRRIAARLGRRNVRVQQGKYITAEEKAEIVRRGDEAADWLKAQAERTPLTR